VRVGFLLYRRVASFSVAEDGNELSGEGCCAVGTDLIRRYPERVLRYLISR
jgi:hypothetical protein